MVYAAGSYTVKEFATIGVPLQLFLTVAAGFILTLRNSWQKVWIVSWVAYACVAILPAAWQYVPMRYTTQLELWAGSCCGLFGRGDGYRKRVSNVSVAESEGSDDEAGGRSKRGTDFGATSTVGIELQTR